MIDENNLTALKRYDDLNYVLNYFESTNPMLQHPQLQWSSQKNENKENMHYSNIIHHQLGNILLDVSSQPS